MSYGGYDGGATQFAGGYMAECVRARVLCDFFPRDDSDAMDAIEPGTDGGRWTDAPSNRLVP